MKKISLLIIACILLSLCACNTEEQVSQPESSFVSDHEESSLAESKTENSNEISAESYADESSKPESAALTKDDLRVFLGFAEAEGISPEKLSLIKTSYLVGQGGIQYEADSALKSKILTDLKKYLKSANMTFDFSKLRFIEDSVPYSAEYNGKITVDHSAITVIPEKNILEYSESLTPEAVLSEPSGTVNALCKYLGLDKASLSSELFTNRIGEKCLMLYVPQSATEESVFSAYSMNIKLTFDDNGKISKMTATDISGYDTLSFDALSYSEAYEKLLKGEYINAPFDQGNFDNKDEKRIIACELSYKLITDCACEECRIPYGYYVPVYAFSVADENRSDDVNFVSEFYVPAVDVGRVSSYLEKENEPPLNHFWLPDAETVKE